VFLSNDASSYSCTASLWTRDERWRGHIGKDKGKAPNKPLRGC
jgi:hypothetical protein